MAVGKTFLESWPAAGAPPARPEWPAWLVLWKAAVTVLFLGMWGMFFAWYCFVGFIFSSGPVPSIWEGFGKGLAVSLLTLLPVAALWATGVAIWTERRHWTLKVGLAIGVVIVGSVGWNALDSLPVADHPGLTAAEAGIVFCLASELILMTELWRQFRPRSARNAHLLRHEDDHGAAG